jgi:Zn-dependent peptidase ImmA (M78 family)/DNA-binding XRE family transcriptional regulator
MTSLPVQPFNAARLRQARQRRGLTKVALGRAVGLTARRIAEYENEGVAPPPATVGALADALGFPPPFLLRADPPDVSADNVSFRSFSRLAAARRDAALSAAASGVELARWLDDRLHLPPPDISDLAHTEPEIAAAALRSEWGLGEDPMPNAIHLLEAHGVRVFSIVEDCAQLDAFSLWSDGVPFVFLTSHKSPERSRWDAAHELGHLVLHASHRPQGRQQEQEADAFAAALLLPRLGVLGQAPRVPSLRDIVDHKVLWRVSALAYIRRLHQLGAVTDWHYRSLVVEAARVGYRREEGDIERETSKLVPAALGLLADDGVGVGELAAELDLPVDELRGLLFGAFGALVPLDGGGQRTGGTRARLRLAGQ